MVQPLGVGLFFAAAASPVSFHKSRARFIRQSRRVHSRHAHRRSRGRRVPLLKPAKKDRNYSTVEGIFQNSSNRKRRSSNILSLSLSRG